MTHRVFVYGTLKRGHPNNPLLVAPTSWLKAYVSPLVRMGTGWP